MIVCRSVSGIEQEFPDANSVETMPEWAQILVKRGKLIPIETMEEEIPPPPDENASKEVWAQYIEDNFEPVPDLSRMSKPQMIDWVRKQT
ncbi:MAG: hypothetical protein ACRDSF_00100 [Pseudonocardiaceae bacterium]